MTDTLIAQEFQGLYGPYEVSELLIQKIWLHGAFDTSRLVDHRGRRVEIVFPGQWNRLAGPDFKRAILEFDGQRVEGDVEIHFGLRDWQAHGHASDPAYDDVILHVLYHPRPANGAPTRTVSGQSIPCVSLMPLLWYDLEAYALEDSLVESTGAGEDPRLEVLFEYELEERRRILRSRAMRRWDYKRRFAAKRVERYGWDEACHLTAMEILGYSANRIPMLWVAGAYPLGRLRDESPSIDRLWECGGRRWTTLGCRPTNYPRRRLGQYLDWVRRVPDWPKRLEQWAKALNAVESGIDSTSGFRKVARLGSLKESLFESVLGETVSASKLDTLVCDGFLPLLDPLNSRELGDFWFHWYPGNLPDDFARRLKRFDLLERGRYSMCNGWGQGLLGAGDAPIQGSDSGQADA